MPSFRESWSHATPYLAFCVFTFADTSTFGSLQALPSWLNTFGTPGPTGAKMLTTYQKAIANSVVFVGRLVGTTTFEPVAERLGYKPMLYGVALLQILAVIIQLTSRTWVVFTVGRVFAYATVGYIECLVPMYSAEIAPPALRGFCAGLLTPVITLSSVWGAGMCQAYAKEVRKIGWMVPIGVQMIPAVLILFLAPFTVESPRWLVAHGRSEEALKNLRRLRRRVDVDAGLCEAEIKALEQVIEHERSLSTARWRDLFTNPSYRRRAIISPMLFWFYQTTGNSFYNAYGPSFFKEIGLGSKSFTYATVVQLVGAVGSAIAIFLTDRVGRRPLIITGACGLILFDFLIAGLGGSAPRTTTNNNVVVASFILMIFSTKVSWATHCFLVASELGGLRMRKKVMMVGTTMDVFSNWLVSFTSPYIMNKPYGGIGGKIGYIFGGMAVLSLLFAIFVVPELRGRGLEEVDELFERPHWGWQYKHIKTTGMGAQIARIQAGDVGAANLGKGVDDDVKVGACWRGRADAQEDVQHVEKV
ncbi:hypothetical protein Q8F55_007839 [Vanrija albida]|uniref:Major facilitator superfamily (MFS) profile domain-containing protein n=1 Tax=Vanrija albida TaxID=181172 RepID=A0ABR3PUM3_9TREE